MSKKFMALCLSALLIFGAGINVFAANDAVLVSGESLSDLENTNQPQSGGAKQSEAQADSQNSANQSSSNQQNLSNQQRTTTMDNSEAVVEQNRTKNNAMMHKGLYEGPAVSRYSSRRVALAPDIAGTKYAEAAEILGALGIMVGDAETGNFRPNDNILRSEMAKVSVYSVGLEDVAKGAVHPTRFPDVVSNHWANGPINVADQQGMIIGDDVGTFRPDDPVLFQEAVTIMVRALGYEPKAQTNGGYPTGYMVTASDAQMLKGITATGSQPATRGDIAQLVFNSLTVNLMEQTGFGSNSSYEVVDKTLLYDRLNVEKSYGQITGTHETTLTGGSTTAEDYITINDKTFVEGDTLASQLLGYNVVYYARIDSTTDEKTLIAVIPQDSKNNELTIPAGNIVSVTGASDANKTVTYWRDNTDDATTKTATIVANPVYILNGKFAQSLTTEQMKPESGNLILLDTDTNNVYDIVFVNHFNNLVVETVSSATGRVTDKYNNGSLVLDPENESIDFVLIKNGTEITPDELVEWNVISYTISEDKQLIKAYVSDQSVSGTVTRISQEGFKIDDSDTTYQKASSYPNEINLKDRGTFYLDMEGKVAAVNTTSNAAGNAIRGSYGYLVGAAKSDEFNDSLKFKIFAVDGTTRIIEGTSKIRLNDKYGLTSDEVLSAFGKDGTVTPQLITYETNASGNLTGMDIAVDKTSTAAPNKGVFTKNISAAEQVYKSASNMLGNVKVTENTVIFDIPSDAGTDTTRFAVRNRSMFSNNTPYDIIVYDLQEDFSANVIIVTNSTGVTETKSPIVLVDEIAQGQNDEFETVDILYGLENGSRVELMATGRTVFVKDGGQLQQGDIFQYSTNAKGEVDKITLLFDSSKKTTEFTNTVGTDLSLVYGRVTKKFADSVNVSVNGQVRNYTTQNVLVYEYNSQRKNNNISVVTSGDIEVFEEGNEVRLFVKIYDDQVSEMVIVR